MWGEMARIIHEVRPRFVFVENSPMLTSRGLGRVLGDLASMGFDAKWGVLGANDIGANHQRDRIWIRGEQMGNSNNNGQIAPKISPIIVEGGDRNSTQQKQARQLERSSEQYAELAYTERMGWEERASERGTPEDKKGSNNLSNGSQTITERQTIANTECERLEGRKDCGKQEVTWTRSGGSPIGDRNWWAVEPNVGRVAYGLAARMERLKAIGNGQVPLCAATAWRILK
jgi:DNA (cytosine-5)-methyltransferase 1